MPTDHSDIDLKSINAKLKGVSLKLKKQGQYATLKEFIRLVRLLTNTHACILTFINLSEKQISKIACSSENQEFEEFSERIRKIKLNKAGKGVSFEIASKGIPYETYTLQKDGGGVASKGISTKFGLNYAYCYPIIIEKDLKGYLNFFSREQTPFSEELKHFIGICSKFAEVPIRQYEIEKTHNQTLKEAIEEMATMRLENRRDEILRIALKHAIKLLDKDKVFSSVLKLDEKTGMLLELEANPPAKQNLSSIPFGKGYCSQALIEEKELIKDINSADWDDIYVDAWGRKTKNEMVIPLLIKNEQIRVMNNVELASRPIGVLNFESPNLNEFTPEDFYILLPLISQASLLIEKLATERKLSQLRDIERQVLTKQNWKETLKIIAEGIKEALGFEVVNISLVDDSKKMINTEVIIGIEEEKIEKFLQTASHLLDSNDIQASIVSSKKIEVLDESDNRFDKAIWKEFGHEISSRVFVPMISRLTNKCVGIVEAAHYKGFKSSVYESDIQVLQQFAELIVEALEKQNSRIMDKISHELRAPVSGILGNIDRLKAHHRHWKDWFIDVRLEDIELDCEILKHNILELEYFLGRPFPKVKIGDKPICVMKEMVLKTIRQLKPVIEDEGFYFDIDSCVDRDDLDKINIYTDKIQLGQVFYNLVANSIRYANKKSKIFNLKIIVDTETDKDYFIIRFQDFGIGIKEEYKDKIFDDYFRSPEAIRQFVSGAGLGLTISQSIMRNRIKGDLILANSFNPTEFNVKIPKRYERKPL